MRRRKQPGAEKRITSRGIWVEILLPGLHSELLYREGDYKQVQLPWRESGSCIGINTWGTGYGCIMSSKRKPCQVIQWRYGRIPDCQLMRIQGDIKKSKICHIISPTNSTVNKEYKSGSSAWSQCVWLLQFCFRTRLSQGTAIGCMNSCLNIAFTSLLITRFLVAAPTAS